MPIGGIVAGIGALASGIFGGNAAENAAKTQANAANNATNLTAQEFLSNQQNLEPFKDVGSNAAQVLGQLFGITWSPNQVNNGVPTGSFNTPISSLVGPAPSPTNPNLISQFQASPGYQYNLQQSSDAIQNSAAGKTGAVSGNMLKALQTNASGLAAQDWNNFYQNLLTNYSTRYNDAANSRNQIINVLGSLGGMGQNAAAGLGGLGQSAVGSIGNNLNLAASANAAGTLGATNAYTNAFNSLSNNPSVNSALSFLFNGGNGSGYGNGDFGGGGSF